MRSRGFQAPAFCLAARRMLEKQSFELIPNG